MHCLDGQGHGMAHRTPLARILSMNLLLLVDIHMAAMARSLLLPLAQTLLPVVEVFVCHYQAHINWKLTVAFLASSSLPTASVFTLGTSPVLSFTATIPVTILSGYGPSTASVMSFHTSPTTTAPMSCSQIPYQKSNSAIPGGYSSPTICPPPHSAPPHSTSSASSPGPTEPPVPIASGFTTSTVLYPNSTSSSVSGIIGTSPVPILTPPYPISNSTSLVYPTGTVGSTAPTPPTPSSPVIAPSSGSGSPPPSQYYRYHGGDGI
jgi:hypothetical protein